ncbi:hypothetical protein ACE6H2_023725 [Prunus campanulata]
MELYFEFQHAVENDRDNAQDDQKRSNAHAIVQYSMSIKIEMWNELLPKLMPLMESNKISIPQELDEPKSY